MGFLDEHGMPTPKYKKDKAKVAKHLSKTYKEMFDYLILQLQFNPDEPQTIRQTEIMRQINMMLKELDKDLAKEIEKLIKKVFKDGQAYHLLSVKEAKTWGEAVDSSSFNKIQRAKVEALISDTYDDILLATKHTSDAVKKVVKDTVKKVAQYHSLRNTNYTQQIDELKEELSRKGLSKKIVKDGFVGITDSAGRKWQLDHYCKMVITTKVNDAFIQGITHEMEETGFDLAVISEHGAKDKCRHWEGVVISMTGATKGYPTYREARATNEIWHPNCEHTVHPIRSLDMLPDEDIAQHKQKVKELGNYKSRVYKRKNKKS